MFSLVDLLSSISYFASVRQYVASEHSIKSRRRYEKEKEVLSTERSYVSSIQTVVQRFFEPLNRSVKAGYTDVSQEEINGIFSNINMILSVNTTFLRELEFQYIQYPMIPLGLGSVFLRMVRFTVPFQPVERLF